MAEGVREYNAGAVSMFLEWLGKEHGDNAIQILRAELRHEFPLRREGAVTGLGYVFKSLISLVHCHALKDKSPGVRSACIDALDDLENTLREVNAELKGED